MYQLEIIAFARAVLDDTLPKTDGVAGKTALAVALAAIESIESGLPVTLT